MYVESYDTCQKCGRALDRSTMYRQHAVCQSCQGTATA